MGTEKSNWKRWVAWGALIIGLCLMLYFYREVYSAVRGTWLFCLNRDNLNAYVTSFGAYAPLAFIGLQILQVLVAPIPGELTGVAGGYLFGTGWGFLYSTAGLCAGSVLAFVISRRLGSPFVRRLVGWETMAKFDYLMEHQGAFFSFIFFLIPGTPKDYFCYLLGLSPMRLFTFFVISTIGRIPGTVLLTMQGQAIRSENYRSFFVILGLGLLLIALAMVYRERIERWLKFKRKKATTPRPD